MSLNDLEKNISSPNSSSDDQSLLEFIWCEITNQCNLECGHCYAESGPRASATGTMTFQNWCAVMDEARQLNCESLQFIGGEPTLHPHFLSLMAQAKEKGFRQVEVYTNATRLTPAMCQALKEHDARVAVSFYAADESVHDRITGRNGSFQRTVAGIKDAVRCGVPIRAGVVLTNKNEDASNEALKFLEKLGVTSVRVDRERKIGRARKQKAGGSILGELCGGCGRNRLAVNCFGEVSPCVFSHQFLLGNVREGLGNITRNEELKSFLRRMGAASPAMCSPHVCFPNNCDPNICDPINCVPKD